MKYVEGHTALHDDDKSEPYFNFKKKLKAKD